LTPLERRRWKQLERQLRTGDRPTSRSTLLVVIAGAALMLTTGAAVGGAVAVAAVATYLCVSAALWGLFRLLWRAEPSGGRMHDLI
jgi:hypothetical protein